MTHLLQTNTKGFDDLVFDQRNRAYGAYVLRRDYSQNVLKSLLIGFAVSASILLIPYLAILLHREVQKQINISTSDTHYVDVVQPDDPIVEPPKGDPEPPKENTLINVIPIVSAFVNINDSLNTMEDMKDAFSGLHNHKGTGDNPFVDIGIPESDSDPVDIKVKVYDKVKLDRQPEFPGLYQFLADNLVYPQHAKDIGLEGKVYVTFIIDEFGNVTHPEVPRPIGGGLDEEALRVMKIMPRWKPGIFAGRPVKVAYQLPIVFKLN